MLPFKKKNDEHLSNACFRELIHNPHPLFYLKIKGISLREIRYLLKLQIILLSTRQFAMNLDESRSFTL